MPQLLLGPIIRHTGADDATVWVQTDRPCTVEILGRRGETFCVDGHHFALVVLSGLDPGRAHPYEVHLDGERAWPVPDAPGPSVVRTVDPDRPTQLVFGSCRTSLPHEPPYLQEDGEREGAHGIDALWALARRMAGQEVDEWPDHLLMLGDQIYADELSPAMRDAVARGRGTGDPGELCDFADYALAYREAWGAPPVRWLLANLASSMVFDDHEVHAQWKLSARWHARRRGRQDYERRIIGALAAYWVFQHLGNLSPGELAEDAVFRRVRAAGDGAPILRELARHAEQEDGHSRWSFCRDLGRSRLVVLDSRAGRQLDGTRRMVSPAEWRWIADRADGDYDHLLLASSVPFFLVHGLQDLELAVDELAGGSRGRPAARAAERFRELAVLDHWASFPVSYDELLELLEHVATGGTSRRRPRSVVLLSGDVHHCYLARVRLGTGDHAPLWQAVCSPYRKGLSRADRAAMRLGAMAPGRAIGRGLARFARVRPRAVRWDVVERPSYVNQLGTLFIAPGGEASVRVETTVGSSHREPALRPRFEHRLSG